jgi:hypothetical protein
VGIAVANDLTAPEKGGYAVLTMSAQYGVEFMTDSNGDGKLDTWAGGGSSYHPAWLRLVRDGTTYTAYASAVNLNYPGQTTQAIFDRFDVSG